MVAEHGTQRGNRFRVSAVIFAQIFANLTEQPISTIGFSRMQIEFRRTAKDMQTRLELLCHDPLPNVVSHLRIMSIGDERGEWIVRGLMTANKEFGFGGGSARQQIHAQQAARSGAGEGNIVAVDSTIEHRREHAVLVDTQPGAAGAQVATGDDLWPVLQQTGRCRWAIVVFVPIGRNH